MTLNLRIHKYIDSDGGPPPEVFATIYAVDPNSGRRRESKSLRELVPISTEARDFRSLKVGAGHYLVEVAMPSGDLLSDQVSVPASGNAELVLQAEDSPHEWLGWQHLMGNVPAVPTRTRTWRGVTGKPTDAAGGSLEYLTTPLPDLIPSLTGDAWKALARLPKGPTSLVRALNTGGPTRTVPISMRDEHLAVYRMLHGNAAVSGATALQSALPRDFIAVPQGETVELVSLPMPWYIGDGEREAVIEIIVQQTARYQDFSTSLTVRDDKLGVLLGYLSSGSLGAAREFADTATAMLYGKVRNPLAAAAGGYALVGTVVDSADHEWHQWVKNLCNWFEQIPDGAIQLAQLHLRRRRDAGDFDEAAKWLKVGYRRGVPFYSLGVRWLLEGLEKLSRFDPELEEMSEAVRAIAWRIHPQSAFTIIQLDRE